MCEQLKDGEHKKINLKILYTLAGTESQKFIVKPADPIEVQVYSSISIGIVAIAPCLAAIREASPDFASVCDTHADEYAVYSADFAEEGHPLQSHGKVSQHTLTEATGRLGSNRIGREQLELVFHLLPCRKPEELMAEFQAEFNAQQFQLMQSPRSQESLMHPTSHSEAVASLATWSDTIQDKYQLTHSFSGSDMPVSLQSSVYKPEHKNMNMSLQNLQSMPQSLVGGYTPGLPSSPPVRAKPNKIAVGERKRESPGQSAKKRKLVMPSSDDVSQCGNCKVLTASTWRRIKIPGGGDQLLCNACGLYYKTKKIMRPQILWDKEKLRNVREGQEPKKSRKSSNSNPIANPNSQPANQTQPQPQNADVVNKPVIGDQNADLAEENGGAHQFTSPSINTGLDMSMLNLPPYLHNQSIFNPGSSPQAVDSPASASQPALHSDPALDPKTPVKQTQGVEIHAPDSIQKLFFSTFTSKTPESVKQGSPNKWFDRVIDPTTESSCFESFLKSPTPRKSTPTRDVICSSPPTSSTLFSDYEETSKIKKVEDRIARERSKLEQRGKQEETI